MFRLSKDQIQFFHDEGYLVLPGFLSEEEITALKEEMKKLVDNWDPKSEKEAIFSTENLKKTINDHYWLTSGDKIRYFLEEDAVDKENNLTVDKHRSLNKVAHALADLNPVYKNFTKRPVFEHMAKDLGFKDPKIVQSMYIFKQPHFGGTVTPHQDATWMYTEPISCVAWWFALDDCLEENGCLWVLPKSHKQGLKDNRRFKVKDMSGFFDPPYPAEGSWSFWDKSKFIPLVLKRGGLVLLHGTVAHFSNKNTSDKPRNVYTYHVVEGQCKYPADNWLQRPNMPFTGFEN